MDDHMAPAMALALSANFGSVERWRDDLVAVGKAVGGGPGGAQLSFVPRDGTLVNRRTADHAPADGVPILTWNATDCDIDAFVRAVRWALVYERYQHAVETSSEGLGATAEQAAGAHLVDVRRAAVFEQSDALVAGARWRDPAFVGAWAAELPKDEPVVVYCVYGHEVGRATAIRLRAAGIDARFLVGGFDAWRAAGRPLSVKPGS